MPLPKRRHSRARQATRRANWKMVVPNVISCPRCHEPRMSHHACPSCGFYNNRLVIETKEKAHKE
jgi:large subunit ribosomal protein L32